MKIDWFSALLTPLIVFLIFHFLRKVKRLSLTKEVVNFQPTEKLKEQYSNWMGVSFFIFLFGAGISSYVLYVSLVGFSKLYYSWIQPDAIHTLGDLTIALPALFAAIVIQDYPYRYFGIKHYGKETFEDLNKLVSQHYGLNSTELNKLISTYGVIVCLIFYVNVLKTASYIREETITVSSFLMFAPKQYSLKDIKELSVSWVQKKSEGKIVNKPIFYIYFNDGYVWETDPWEDSKEFIQILQHKTGLKLREAGAI